MTQEILTALRNIEDKIMREPTAFNWTPSMQAIWPKDMRPTMSGLLAIWEAMRDAAVYGEAAPDGYFEKCRDLSSELMGNSKSPKPLAATMNHMWQVWDGGRQPVSDDTQVVVKFRNSSMGTKPDKASNWSWLHDDSGSDIIAWRLA